ncbi:unnamed protein product [Prunus armeniaca]
MVPKSDVARHGGCRRQHKACVSQGNVAEHEGVEGNTKLARRRAMWLGMMVPKATQDVARHDGAGGNTKLACRKAMWLGMMMPRAT